MKEVTSLGPRTLTGRFITLEPMEQRHHAGLIAAAADPETWRYIPFDVSKGYASRIPDFTHEMAMGRQLTFVVRHLADGEIIGSSAMKRPLRVRGPSDVTSFIRAPAAWL